MPYKSKAQQAKFHAMESRGEISHETVKEWDAATKKKKGGFAGLPDKAKGATHEHPRTPINASYQHEAHGKAGSHESSHKSLGGARAKIMTGSPEEQ